jgi:hypothetical protein
MSKNEGNSDFSKIAFHYTSLYIFHYTSKIVVLIDNIVLYMILFLCEDQRIRNHAQKGWIH